jgi:hypothetical protein
MYAKAKEEGHTPTANKKVWKTVMLSKVKWNGSEFLPDNIKTPEDLKRYREYQAKESVETKKREGIKKLDLRKDLHGVMRDSKGLAYKWDDDKAEWSEDPEVVIRNNAGNHEISYYAICQACQEKSESKVLTYYVGKEREDYFKVLKSHIRHKPGCKLS